MKLKGSYFFTLREDVKEEDSISGKLLVRSGMIKRVSSGVYMYLPLGLKVLKNIENIIKEEMNNINSEEVLMPALISESYFEKSNRVDTFGDSIFKLNDRYNRPYVLGPTHEELFTVAAGFKTRSYKDLPISLYQVQNKFRDETRPRYGLIRVREFLMKDAYTFDKDLESMDVSYNKMFNAYKNIFDKMNIDYKIVQADTGAMGGLLSEEFQAISPIGEDILVLSDSSDYASNIEVAEVVDNTVCYDEYKIIEKVHTPGFKTIEEVSKFLNKEERNLIKNLVYKIDGKLHLLLIPGNRDLNETKVLKLLGGLEIEPATDEEISDLGSTVGYVGPFDLNVPIVLDRAILNMRNFVVGANELDYHFINVNIKDFDHNIVGDITNVIEGDLSPDGKGRLYFEKGIEIGNTFKLGTKYAKDFDLTYSDENNKLQDVYMGSYGIGLGRVLSAVVEQNNDDNGIIWPVSIAPFKVCIVLINNDYKEHASQLYDEFNKLGIDVLLDDRDLSPGVKFKDLDLIGIPHRIVLGRGMTDNKVEYKKRDVNSSEDVNYDDIVNKIIKEIR